VIDQVDEHVVAELMMVAPPASRRRQPARGPLKRSSASAAARALAALDVVRAGPAERG